jgi:hypothetical protein
MDTATSAALSDPAAFKAALERTMEGQAADEDIQEMIAIAEEEITKGKPGTALPIDTVRKIRDPSPQGESSLPLVPAEREEVSRVATRAVKLERATASLDQKHSQTYLPDPPQELLGQRTGETPELVSLPGSPTTSDAPPVADSSQVSLAPRPVDLAGKTDLELFQAFVEEQFSDFTSLVTRLQRRLELVEQRLASPAQLGRHTPRQSTAMISASTHPARALTPPPLLPPRQTQPGNSTADLVAEILDTDEVPPGPLMKLIRVRAVLSRAGVQVATAPSNLSDHDWDPLALTQWVQNNTV